MGLDQYIYTNSKHCKRDAERAMDEFEKKFRHKSQVAIYWRKCNAVHKWFVDNVQNGEDDCGTYDVSVNELLELARTCEKVVNASKLVEGKVLNGYINGEPNYENGLVIEDATVANELLPTTEGFFFGSQEYNEWYLADLKYTAEAIYDMLENVMHDPESDFSWHYIHEDEPDWWVEFQYHSSW